jgi:NADH-ubiquinone oxidoreductase chain 4L
MNLSLILFIIGTLGFVLNRKNIILMLISIEIMLLAITFLRIILVAFYRLRGSIAIEFK